MHKKSPAGGEDILYIPFLILQEGPLCVKQKTLLPWYNEGNI